MSFSGVFRFLRSERGITRGPFGGYLYFSMIVTAVISGSVFATQNGFFLDGMQQILIFSCMALSYDLFSGYTGYYNLGYGAFVAFGAYSFAFTSNNGTPVELSFVIAGIGSAIFAFVMSYPFLRLKGAYFAIATLALILLLQIFDTNLYRYTGGTAGIILKYPTAPLGTELFFGSVGMVLLTMYVHSAIGRSRFGLALRSIKEEEEVAESFGVNAFRMKQIALIFSGFFAGVSGGLFAIYLGFINADNVLGLGFGLFPVVAAIAGGTGIFLGPFVGSFLLTLVKLFIPSFVGSINPTLNVGPLVIIGFVLVIVGLFVPGGVLRVRFLQDLAFKNVDEKIAGRRAKTVASQE